MTPRERKYLKYGGNPIPIVFTEVFGGSPVLGRLYFNRRTKVGLALFPSDAPTGEYTCAFGRTIYKYTA